MNTFFLIYILDLIILKNHCFCTFFKKIYIYILTKFLSYQQVNKSVSKTNLFNKYPILNLLTNFNKNLYLKFVIQIMFSFDLIKVFIK